MGKGYISRIIIEIYRGRKRTTGETEKWLMKQLR